MKQKYINLFRSIFVLAGLTCLMSCNDSFMDRFPETNITEAVFFTTPEDLKTYTNGMYGYIGSGYWDLGTDNTLYIEEPAIYRIMRGEITPKTVGRWGGWERIRTINYMLNRVDKVQGDPTDINHYVGLARMFRAYCYYGLVKTYSDVPWYSRDLQTTDVDLLYKKQDPRKMVVDSIMADLDFAVKNIKDGASKTRIFRNMALAIQARIALHEGTFRKYHKELGLNDGDKFLKIAENACKKIMETGEYSLSTENFEGLPAYASIFRNQDLTKNPEMIFVEDYDKALGRRHNAASCFDWTTGLSRDLMEDYQVVEDGKAYPFQQVSGYDKKTVLEVFENRDPRLEQTFMKPGYKRAGREKAHVPDLGCGGYPQVKFEPCFYEQVSWDAAYTDLPVIRYAEVLLIYAEAKAELGTLTQEDVNKTVNPIRQRAGVPDASLAAWLATIDPVQEQHYPNVKSSQKGAVLEIRRERRVELACEGFRYDDLMRWACGKLLEKAPEGSYIPGLGYQDLTGDGKPNVAIVNTKADADTIPQKDKDDYKLLVYVLEGNTFSLTEGDKGHIYITSQHNKFKFEEPKYYYYPLNEQDMVINPNLEQNKYWK